VDINSYIDELKADTTVNELNLRETSLRLPGLKAKWVSRLIIHKNKLNSLQKQKKKLLKEVVPQVRDKLPVKLSDNFIKDKAEEINSVSGITDEIQKEELIIDFLEKAEKVVSSYTYDLGNIVKIVQLETI
jgi:hypothetical protein